MKSNLPVHTCDLIVIGTGMTGMAAALFAALRGIDTVQVGMTSELNFASGLLDLMGVCPSDPTRVYDDPWQAIDALVTEHPAHPYGRLQPADMRAAFTSLLQFLEQNGLPYFCSPERNLRLITPIGTEKTTYAIPRSCFHGIKALADKAGCLIVDFKGLKGFSAVQISQSLSARWPQLKPCRLEFPGSRPGDLYPEQMALLLEAPENRTLLAEAIRPHLSNASYVALPAVLGLYRPYTVFNELQKLLEKPLFEIPTMPPAISGIRLRHVFEQNLPGRDVRLFAQQKVLRVLRHEHNRIELEIGFQEPNAIVHARGAILASGRFFGRGLEADRRAVRETIFDLPVHQPSNRAGWHTKGLFDHGGHPINRAGVETDKHLRPTNKNGQVILPNLFAAGSILAHQDWVRMKCGSGLAITTAYSAVKHFARDCLKAVAQ